MDAYGLKAQATKAFWLSSNSSGSLTRIENYAIIDADRCSISFISPPPFLLISPMIGAQKVPHFFVSLGIIELKFPFAGYIILDPPDLLGGFHIVMAVQR